MDKNSIQLKPPAILLHRSENSVYPHIKHLLDQLDIPYQEVQFLAEISNKLDLHQIFLVIAIIDIDTAGIDFLRSLMNYDQLIQRLMICSKNDKNILEKSINKAHINYLQFLPLDNEALTTLIRKAQKRHQNLLRTFERFEILSKTTQNLFHDKEKYKKEAVSDSLTGLLNRRSFFSLLSGMWERDKAPQLSLAMLDIDHFKKINDNFGHIAGDRVLKQFGQILLGNLREGHDQAFRFGGEEFIIISFRATKKEMHGLAMRILSIVRETAVEFQNQQISFTFSAGISNSEDAASVDELVHLADTALYKAKDEGRNRIYINE